MSYVPVPPPRPNPEAVLALKLSNEFTSEKEKRGLKRASDSSMGSSTSSYSQSSFVSPRPNATPSMMAFASRTPSMVSGRAPYSNNINDNYYRSASTPGPVQTVSPNLPPRMRALQLPAMAARAPSNASVGPPPSYGPAQQYRSATPGAASVRSMAPSTVSNLNIRASTRQRYYNSNRMPAPVPVLPQNQYMMPSTMMAGESISRQGTPMSMMSNQSGSSYYPPQQQQHQQQQRNPSVAGHLSSPPGLAYNNPGQFPQPPGVSSHYTRNMNMNTGAPSRVTSPSPLGQMHTIAEDGHGLTMQRGMVNRMEMQMREALMSRAPSPSSTSVPSLEMRNRTPSPNLRSPSPLREEKPVESTPIPQMQAQQMPQQKRYQLQDRPIPRQQKLAQEIEVQRRNGGGSAASRRSSVSSVPRSPSPQHEFFSPSDNLPILPATPMSAVLPAHPTLPPQSGTPTATVTLSSSSSGSSSRKGYEYGYGGYSSQESSPTVRLNDRPLPRDDDDVDVVGFWRQNNTSPRPLRLVGKPVIEP